MTSRTRTRATQARRSPQRADRRRWLLGALLAAAAVAGVLTLAFATQERSTATTGAAPPFTLPTTDGGSVSLEAMRGTPVLLYFSEGVGCDSCFAQLADIEASSSSFSKLGVHVVPIMVNGESDVASSAATYGIRTPIALDTTKAVSDSYGILGTGMHAGLPGHSFVLVDANGQILWAKNFPSMYVPSAELARMIGSQLT